MNEIKLIEEIEDAIHNKKYDELLYKVELKLKKLFYKYTTEDVLTLINRTIIFHNYNINCKEENYSEYQRDRHVSLKILLSLPEYYYKNISETGKDSIYDYKSVIDELVGIIAELEYVYYYYPYKNKKDFMLNNENQFYMNYFKSYYFDYPAIEIRDFLGFFKSNINLCEEVLDDNNFKESLELMLYLQEFESNLRKEKLSLNLLFDKDIRRIINSENIYILYPLRTVKKICRKKKINFKTFMKNYAFDLEDNEKKESNLIDILAKSKDKRFMFITSKFLFFPRNYYWMYKMYDIVWRSANISKKIDYGKTIKSLMHENTIFELLKEYFGENNVYANVYLKRTGRQYAEKDFVIFYQNKILSFEAKSNLLPKPELDDSINIDINPADLKIDTYRASGAGGQHVNTTDSAVRITHIPTGVVVQCQNERSQHKNKDTAMKMLMAKLIELKELEQKEKIEDIQGKYSQITWGSQIRSYVFQPYKLVKDHRTNAEIGNVDSVMDGNLDLFINEYLKMNKSKNS